MMTPGLDQPTNIGRKVIIVGTTCAGKTTLARQLSAGCEQPHIELDAIYWGPNWTPLLLEQFRARVSEVIESDSWIMEGNYSQVRDMIWSQADTLIWLDYAFTLIMWRQVVRGLRRSLTREELWNGNRETLRMQFFSRESLIWWAIKTYHRRRRQYEALLQGPTYPNLQTIRLRSPAMTQRWLAEVGC
jgi:adenylate kinase family enzyme